MPAPSLHIGIDAHAIGSRLGGNETYIRGVVAALAAHPEHRYTLYVGDEAAAAEARRLCPAAQVRLIGTHRAVARLGWRLSVLARQDRVDVLHVQYVAPPVAPRFVVMVHDVSFLLHPEWFSKAEYWRFRLTVPWTVRRAGRVVADSENTKRDLVRTTGVAPEKVIVTYVPFADRFRPPDDAQVAAVRREFGLEGRYIICVGNLQPRKNLRRLIAAWEKLRETEPGFSARLVMVGKKAWLFDEILRSAAASRLAEEIVFTGYVADEKMPALYRGADFFVYPSLFEGFGLPPIEAMACGTPVVTADNTSLPEVCGDAAEYVQAESVESIAAGMARLFRDDTRREELRARGLRWAERYRPRALIGQTIRAYEEAART